MLLDPTVLAVLARPPDTGSSMWSDRSALGSGGEGEPHGVAGVRDDSELDVFGSGRSHFDERRARVGFEAPAEFRVGGEPGAEAQDPGGGRAVFGSRFVRVHGLSSG